MRTGIAPWGEKRLAQFPRCNPPNGWCSAGQIRHLVSVTHRAATCRSLLPGAQPFVVLGCPLLDTRWPPTLILGAYKSRCGANEHRVIVGRKDAARTRKGFSTT